MTAARYRGGAGILAPVSSGPDGTQATPGTRVRPGRALLGALLRAAPQLRPRLEKLVWRVVYEAGSLSGRGQAPLNYGYAPLSDDAVAVASDDGYGLQLYAKVAGAIDLTGLDVLEVGCGRGGGTAHVFERLGPRSMTGLDLAASAARRAQKRFGRPGLRYVAGDAENLPFPSESFDAVLNVESSHCYPNSQRFFEEVHRVLRPGGRVLFADIRHPTLTAADEASLFPQKDVASLRHEIQTAGFQTLEEEDITANVVHALHLDTPRRRARVERTMPKLLRPHVLALMAVEGSLMYDEFASRRLTYLRLCLQKP
jgi:SAM-dependent methyltransferase